MVTATLESDPTLSAFVADTTTVICRPVTGASFVFAPSPVQINESVTFTGTVAAGQPPITYRWSFGDGTAEQSGNPIAHTYTVSDTYTVVMTASNACPSTAVATRLIAVSSDTSVFLPLVLRGH